MDVFVLTTYELIVNCTVVHTITSTNIVNKITKGGHIYFVNFKRTKTLIYLMKCW